MATFTENYNLIKPGLEDYYDVADFNDNMDVIDGALAETAGINEKIGNPDDVGGNTIFGKLNGNSLIKSIQRVNMSGKTDNVAVTKTLDTPVIPENCIVLIHSLYTRDGLQISYTLNSDSLSATFGGSGYSLTYSVIFQIIEFC